MPVAVVTNTVSEKKELTSCEGAFVIVRRMTYGEKLHRSNIATQFIMDAKSGGSDKDFRGEMKMQTEEVAYWDFANLVVDHNLEDANGNKLNFKNKVDIQKLDPVIGEEVGEIIDDFNSPESTDEVKN